MSDFPLLITIVTVWLYWGRVGAMVMRARRRSHDLAGLVPEQSSERLMWLVWVPMVAAWLALPIVAVTHASPPLGVPAFARTEAAYIALRWLAAAGGVAAFLITLRCHALMGKNWRMDVSEKQKTALVTDGIYGRIRHPIYAFQVLLMICTAIVVATWPMVVIATIHIAMVAMKAANEERFLLATHGSSYADYKLRTGRFLPRLRAR